MRRKLFVAMLMLLCAVASWGQEFQRHEISYGFGYGGGSESQWDRYNRRSVPDGYKDGFICGVDLDASVYWEYNYNINGRLAVGAIFGTRSFHADYDNDALPPLFLQTKFPKISEEMDTDGTETFAMASVRYKWYRSKRNKFRLYSQVALGYAQTEYSSTFCQDRYYDVGEDRLARIHDCIDYSTEKHNPLAYQFTPIAIETGKNNWHLFFELGTGYKGVMNMGIRYSFHKVNK